MQREALTGFSHVFSLSTTSPSQGYVLAAASGGGKAKWDLYSQDMGGGEEPLIARVQLTSQLIVTASS